MREALSALPFPLTVFHKRKFQPYRFSDSVVGIKVAALCGATAIDLNLCVTRDGVLVVNHWPDITKGGFYDPQGKIRKHAKIHELTWDEVKRLISRDGYRIHRAVDLIRECRNARIIPCFEAKDDTRLAHKETYEQLAQASEQYGWPVIVMSLQHMGSKRGGLRRVRAAKRAGLITMLLTNFSREGRGQVDLATWQYLDLVKGPRRYTDPGRPEHVKRLGPGSRYGCTVGEHNAPRVTRKLEAKW